MVGGIGLHCSDHHTVHARLKLVMYVLLIGAKARNLWILQPNITILNAAEGERTGSTFGDDACDGCGCRAGDLRCSRESSYLVPLGVCIADVQGDRRRCTTQAADRSNARAVSV